MSAYFDAHLPAENAAQPDPKLRGAIIFGDRGNKAQNPHLLKASPLSAIVGPNDSRYPQGADVIDFQIKGAELLAQLREAPSHWWPLLGAPRGEGRMLIVHFSETNFVTSAKGISKLARAFPAVRFLIDPFVNGKESKWMAGVCLADHPNIWMTTRGLFGAEDKWEKRSDREAFHFVIGEVGAGRLLFASGGATAPYTPVEWLESVTFLDEAQRKLILVENAAEALALKLE